MRVVINSVMCDRQALCTMLASCISVANRDFLLSGLSEGSCYATFHSALLFHEKLKKHLEVCSGYTPLVTSLKKTAILFLI